MTYRYVICTGVPATPKTLIAELNQLGAQGWRVIANWTVGQMMYFLLERPGGDV